MSSKSYLTRRNDLFEGHNGQKNTNRAHIQIQKAKLKQLAVKMYQYDLSNGSPLHTLC